MDKSILKHITTFEGYVTNVMDITVSEQQMTFIKHIDMLISSKIKKNILKVPLTDIEKEYASKLGMSVKSGRGCG